jgi:hypothetical protein
MKSTNCKHCISSCKILGKTECVKYVAKASAREMYQKQIKEAYIEGNHNLAKELQLKIDAIDYGSKLNKS